MMLFIDAAFINYYRYFHQWLERSFPKISFQYINLAAGEMMLLCLLALKLR